jgi:hypothetical protein
MRHELRSGCLTRKGETRKGSEHYDGTGVKRCAVELQTEARANSFFDGSGRDERERNGSESTMAGMGEGWPLGVSRNGASVGHAYTRNAPVRFRQREFERHS